MKNIKELKNLIENICSGQLFAVLATSHENQPYTNLVAFAIAEDLKTLVFVTPRDTRKFNYLTKNSRVSLMINNSTNNRTDTSESTGITITGKAHESSDKERDRLLKLFVSKHPPMTDFATSINSAVVCVDISRYDVVERFQNVFVLEFKEKS